MNTLDKSEDSTRANTAYIERLNLTIRQSVAYLLRRSPTHARCERRLHWQLELARCHYNLIRCHTGLRFGREVRTPAMVAGLRDRGHVVSSTGPWDSGFGHAHAIVVEANGTLAGAADPRTIVGSCAGR